MDSTLCGQRRLTEEVWETDRCTGCGACVNLCPYQVYYRDRIVRVHPCNLEDGVCGVVCPRTSTDLLGLRELLFDQADLTPELGAVKGFYLTRATDPETRARAQHGGTVTALVTLALQEGIIDTAVLTGQGPDLLPQGCSVESPAVVKEMSRSKFVVSPTVAEFNRVTKGGGHRVGVVATPCQALALGKLRANPLASCSARAEQLKLVLGLFCGWALDWRSAVQLLGKHIDLSEIEGMDIPPSEYAALQVFAKTGTLSVPLDVVSSCIRPSCLSCDDLTAEFSDLSVGSARLPEGWQEAKDWNQLIVRTWRGEELLDLARTRGVLEFRPVPEGSLPTLKAASVNKKRSALRSALGQ